MTIFTKEQDGKMMVNWGRVIELIIIVALNAATVLITLETKIVYIERSVQEIKDCVREQDRRIIKLEIESAVLKERLEKNGITEGAEDGTAHQKLHARRIDAD